MLTVPKDQLASYVDKTLTPSEWLRVDQQQINTFADATLDHQFIHIDEERAAKTPFGSTIAHGYLTMSLISHFLGEAGIAPEGASMVINYGSDKIRFVQPVKVNSELRGRAVLAEVREKKPGQILIKTRVTIDIKDEENPALIAEILTMFICE